MTKNICPVCGYDELNEPAYNDIGGGSFEICSSCFFQFAYDEGDIGIEEPETHAIHQEWREKWIKDGMPWRGGDGKPDDWNPITQLRNIGIIISG
jgi:hypothetical protein